MSIASRRNPVRDRGARPVGTTFWLDSSRPPADLLSDGGDAPTPAPARNPLPVRGALIQPIEPRIPSRPQLCGPHGGPRDSFDVEVDVVLEHLAPIVTRSALVSSFRREAFHRDWGACDGHRPRVIRIAYARRWLALSSDPRRDLGPRMDPGPRTERGAPPG